MIPGYETAVCDLALDAGAVPDWVHLLPPGKMTGRDGRVFDLRQPRALIHDFNSRGIDLPVDYEHQKDRPVGNGPVPAAGWIRELRLDDTGLWGRVEWTETAREMISRREYRYLSPSLLVNTETREILRISGAGLVYNPNLYLTALASEDPAMSAPAIPVPGADTVDPIRNMALLVGLPPDSSADAILLAILKKGMTAPAPGTEPAIATEAPDPARFVPADAVQELLADRNAHVAARRRIEAEAKVEEAFFNGHITPALRPWALELCARDPECFDTFISKSPAPYAHIVRGANRITAAPREAMTTEAECDVFRQLGIKRRSKP